MLLEPILRERKHIPLLITLLLSVPIVFFHAFRYSFPLGYAGLFTLIAEKICEANFGLPVSVAHYGPGGIPLVYPPLAMYIYALAIKLGISTWAYLRVVPAIFTLFSLIPLYYFSLELIQCRVGSMIAIILVITAPADYYTHVWSAGVVRAFALCLCLTGLFFYIRSLRNFSWRAHPCSGDRCTVADFGFGATRTLHRITGIFIAIPTSLCC